MQQPDIAPVKVCELTFPMILYFDLVSSSGDTVNTVLYAMLSKFRKRMAFWKVPSLAVRPFGKSNMYMKMGMERWWNDTDRGN